MAAKRRLTKVNVTHISLVNRGANKKTIVYKSADAEPDYTREIEISKIDAAQRLVYGIVYSPEEVDTQGDIMSADVIKDMAYGFMEAGRTKQVDKQHDFVADEGFVAESWLTKAGDPMFTNDPVGSWAVAIKVTDDATWAQVEAGTIKGLSLAGMAQGEPIEQKGMDEERTKAIARLKQHYTQRVEAIMVDYRAAVNQKQDAEEDIKKIKAQVRAVQAEAARNHAVLTVDLDAGTINVVAKADATVEELKKAADEIATSKASDPASQGEAAARRERAKELLRNMLNQAWQNYVSARNKFEADINNNAAHSAMSAALDEFTRVKNRVENTGYTVSRQGNKVVMKEDNDTATIEDLEKATAELSETVSKETPGYELITNWKRQTIKEVVGKAGRVQLDSFTGTYYMVQGSGTGIGSREFGNEPEARNYFSQQAAKVTGMTVPKKSDEDTNTPEGIIRALRKLIGLDKSDEPAKDYTEAGLDYQERQRRDSNAEQLSRKVWTLRDSIDSILGDENVALEAKMPAILASIDQFRADVATVTLKADAEPTEKATGPGPTPGLPDGFDTVTPTILWTSPDGNIAAVKWTATNYRVIERNQVQMNGFNDAVSVKAHAMKIAQARNRGQKSDDTNDQLTKEEELMLKELKTQVAALTTQLADMKKSQDDAKTSHEAEVADLKKQITDLENATPGSRQAKKNANEEKSINPFRLPGA